MSYEDEVYTHLEYLRDKEREYLEEMKEEEYRGTTWWEIKYHLDGIQQSLWVFESALTRVGLSIHRGN